jgi:hypothetical protein
MVRSQSPSPDRLDVQTEALQPETAELLARVDRLLTDGQPAEALDAATRAVRCPWVENARGVCLLRLGRPGQAVEVLRGLVYDPTGLTIRADAEPLFLANYATALLLSGNDDGFLGVLGAVRDRKHPYVTRLTDAVRRWKAGMTWGGVAPVGPRLEPPAAHPRLPPGGVVTPRPESG